MAVLIVVRADVNRVYLFLARLNEQVRVRELLHPTSEPAFLLCFLPIASFAEGGASHITMLRPYFSIPSRSLRHSPGLCSLRIFIYIDAVKRWLVYASHRRRRRRHRAPFLPVRILKIETMLMTGNDDVQ